MIEILNKQKIERHFLNIMKSIYNKIQLTSYMYHTLNGTVWNSFLLNLRKRKIYLFSSPLELYWNF